MMSFGKKYTRLVLTLLVIGIGIFLFQIDTGFTATISARLSGKILIQVESHGEGWYVNPVDLKRYYLGRPVDAFAIVRALGLGISNVNLSKIPVSSQTFPGDMALRQRLSGRILLQIESHGEAWYVNPLTLRRHFLGRPSDAFVIMRSLGLGITNANLVQIIQGQIAIPESSMIPPPATQTQQQPASQVSPQDQDGDEIPDIQDNCPAIQNPDQKNTDAETRQPNSGQVLVRDSEGDACDFDDVIQGPFETGIDCGGAALYSCVACTWCAQSNLEPLRIRGAKDKIDIAFVPSSDYFTSAQDPRLKADVLFLVRWMYFSELEKKVNDSFFSNTKEKVNMPLPSEYKDQFNFYIYKGNELAKPKTEAYTNTANALPSNYATAKSFMDITHVLSFDGRPPGGFSMGFRGSQSPGMLYAEPWGTSGIHEFSHLFLGVSHNGDAADGRIGWGTLDECRTSAQQRGWPDLCHIRPDSRIAMYDCSLDSGQICVLGNGGFRYDNVDRSTLAASPIIFGPAEVARFREVFSSWGEYDSTDPIP